MAWSNRVTRTVESLHVSGLQARANVKSNEISLFSYIFFATKLYPTSYTMAPNELKMLPNVVLAILIAGYLDLRFFRKQFPLYFSPSRSVISTILAKPCCKKYSSLSFTCPKMTRDEHGLGFGFKS